MNLEMARAFLSMGYRRRVNKTKEKTVWVKPVAQVCFVFHEKQARWYNMFLDVAGKLSVWNSHVFKSVEDGGTYVQQIKGFEFDTRVDLWCTFDTPKSESDFEFIDLQDALELELGGLGVT